MAMVVCSVAGHEEQQQLEAMRSFDEAFAREQLQSIINSPLLNQLPINGPSGMLAINSLAQMLNSLNAAGGRPGGLYQAPYAPPAATPATYQTPIVPPVPVTVAPYQQAAPIVPPVPILAPIAYQAATTPYTPAAAAVVPIPTAAPTVAPYQAPIVPPVPIPTAAPATYQPIPTTTMSPAYYQPTTTITPLPYQSTPLPTLPINLATRPAAAAASSTYSFRPRPVYKRSL